MNRRGFLTGLVSALAAPAIVRVESLMPVRVALRSFTFEDYERLVLRPMVNKLAEQVADQIMNGESYNGSWMGFKASYDNTTERASCLLYPYQPLKIQSIWASDLFIDKPARGPTSGS